MQKIGSGTERSQDGAQARLVQVTRAQAKLAEVYRERCTNAGQRYLDAAKAAGELLADRPIRSASPLDLWRDAGTTGSTSRNVPSCSGTPCASAATTGSNMRRPASRRSWISSGKDCRCPHVREARELCPRPDHAAGWRRDGPGAPALRHHRSAGRPWARHRRVQAGLAGRGGAQGRAPGLLRDLFSRTGAWADPRGCLARRGGIPPHCR